MQVANHYRQVLVYTQFRWSEIFSCSLRNTCILNRSSSLAILIPVCSSPALDLLEVDEEFDDLEADTQAEGREAEGGH